MIPSPVTIVTELVEDGTNFNNCFLNEMSQFTCKVCGNTSQECFPMKRVHYQQTPPALKIRPYSAARRILYSQVHVPYYEIRNF